MQGGCYRQQRSDAGAVVRDSRPVQTIALLPYVEWSSGREKPCPDVRSGTRMAGSRHHACRKRCPPHRCRRLLGATRQSGIAAIRRGRFLQTEEQEFAPSRVATARTELPGSAARLEPSGPPAIQRCGRSPVARWEILPALEHVRSRSLKQLKPSYNTPLEGGFRKAEDDLAARKLLRLTRRGRQSWIARWSQTDIEFTGVWNGEGGAHDSDS